MLERCKEDAQLPCILAIIPAEMPDIDLAERERTAIRQEPC